MNLAFLPFTTAVDLGCFTILGLSALAATTATSPLAVDRSAAFALGTKLANPTAVHSTTADLNCRTTCLDVITTTNFQIAYQ
ncbi:hypothetical protein [Rarobacter incanus]|uniref:hypothetical protein n=1 Tax=Rarobacter incanus TaxID=153494 RepID=UPI001153234F|nr:hypothetical protein [Rarobacter incanus]